MREYVAKFQQITSRLDWDEEALADKFLGGLKPKIQIHFSEEPKTDRGHWNRQEQGFRFRTGTNTETETETLIAKVDLDKAKKDSIMIEVTVRIKSDGDEKGAARKDSDTESSGRNYEPEEPNSKNIQAAY